MSNRLLSWPLLSIQIQKISFKIGWAGVALIFIFTVVSCYCGTRLGICANILAERYEEFRNEIRDPYPAMGFKAYGKPGR